MRRLVPLIGGLADQAIASLGTLLFLASAARLLTPDEFGRFAFGLATATSIVSVVRAICGETLIVRLRSDEKTGLDTRHMLGAALIISVGVAVFVLMASFLLTGRSGLLQATAIAIPGIVLQDAGRHALIANRRIWWLVGFDTTFVVVTLLAIQLAGRSLHEAGPVLVAWGLSAAAISVSMLAGTGWWPALRGSVGWLRSVWMYSSAYAMEALAGAAVGYSTIVMISAFASDAEVGAFRATVSVYGLTSIASNFLRSTVLREVTLQAESSPEMIIRSQRLMAVFQVIVVIAAAIALLLLPMHVGEFMFGATWSLVATLLAAGAVNRLAASLSVIPSVALRALQVSWTATRLRIIVSLVGLGFGPVGALLAGARGALFAESFSYLLLAGVLQLQVTRALSERRHGTVDTREAVLP